MIPGRQKFTQWQMARDQTHDAATLAQNSLASVAA
jgi:hypothetical protein